MSVALVSHETPLQVVPIDAPISKQHKAAILLSVLIKAGATPNLDNIATGSLKRIVDIMASFGEVDRRTVDLVILEFLSELQDFGLSMRGDLEDTLTSLKGHVSDKALEKIRKAYVRSPSVDVWVRVASADAAQLQTCLDNEHLQVSATVLSKIPSTLAAQVLGGMDATRARETMLAIINSRKISADVIELIGQSISETMFDENAPSAFAKSPMERAGDIMNFAQSDIRDRLLEDFGKTDPDAAEKIRKVMFTFADIPARIQPRDVSAITRTVEPEILLRAMKNAPTEAEFLLAGLSTRIADQLREELSELEPVKKKDAEAAMNELIIGIRKLESSGEINLITEEEPDEMQ
ncbi:hypothetical protein A9Q96_10160 [Rhodobacterales bacterium 52_120_T64]|nr:hypothetical protein A9Q96_10160 [Rhodobacterales bacterium 52_120_T64]